MCTHFASLAGVYAVMESGRPVAAHSAQYRVTVKFWNKKKKQKLYIAVIF
jgi:hypothetical protein